MVRSLRLNHERATAIPKEDTLAYYDFLRRNLDCEVPAERVETPKVRVHSRGYRKFKKGESSDIQEEGCSIVDQSSKDGV